MRGHQNRDLRNRIGGFLSGFAFVSFWIFLFVVEWWAHTGPTQPNRALGQVYAHNEHGAISYFTAFQTTSSSLMFWASFVCMGLAVVVLPKREITIRRLGRLPLAASWKNDDEKGLSKIGIAYGLVVASLVMLLIGPIVVGWVVSRGFVLNGG